MKKKILLGALALLLAISLVAIGCPAPTPTPTPTPTPSPTVKEPIVWQISTEGTRRTWTEQMHILDEELDKITDGGFRVKVVYGDVLCASRDMLDCLKAGLFEAGLEQPFYHPGKAPLLNILCLPMMVAGEEHQVARGTDAFNEHAAVKAELAVWNTRYIMGAPFTNFEMASNVPIRTVEDFEGKRIRAVGGVAQMVEKAGGIPTSMPASEMFGAFQTGLIDGAITLYYGMTAYGWQEVAQYISVGMQMGVPLGFLAANEEAYQKLPDEYKKALMIARDRMYERIDGMYATADVEHFQSMEEAGVEFVYWSPAERARLVDIGCQPVWDEYISDLEAKGLPAQELLEYFLEAQARIKKEMGIK